MDTVPPTKKNEALNVLTPRVEVKRHKLQQSMQSIPATSCTALLPGLSSQFRESVRFRMLAAAPPIMAVAFPRTCERRH